MDQLAVVIVNWKRHAETSRCVSDLLAWRHPPKVWVVDNGSEDGSAERLAEEFPAVRLIASPVNRGYGGGNNLALAAIERDYALLLNNDAGIEEPSVRALCAALEADRKLAAVGPIVVDAADRERVLSAGGRDISRFVATNVEPAGGAASVVADSSADPYPVDYVPGTAVLLRMSAVREVGLLEEQYFFGGELADLGDRLRHRGWGCAVLPRAVAWHDLSHAARNRKVLYRYYILRNRFLYIRRRCTGLARSRQLFWLAYGVYSILRFAARGRWRSARAEILALADGLGGRYGDRNARILGDPLQGEGVRDARVSS